MTFPGAGAQVYYNEAGEPTGWDYPSCDDGGYDYPDEFDQPDGDYDDGEWIICDECGNGYEDGDPEAAKHTADTGHNRWS